MLDCPVCKRKRRFVITWDGAWYGSTLYCACGDRWQDGELGPRPSQRGWREEAQQRFRAMWDNAAPRALYDAYTAADCRFAMTDGDEWEKACADRDAALAAIHAYQSKEAA
jgi:hypothetical protein